MLQAAGCPAPGAYAAQSPFQPRLLRLEEETPGRLPPENTSLLARMMERLCADEDLLLSLPAIARVFALDLQVFRKRVMRWQRSADCDPVEHADYRVRRARAYYNLRDLLPVIRQMIAEPLLQPAASPHLESTLN